MNILFITHNDNFQGSSRSLFSLLEGLRAYPVSPYVIVPSESAFTVRLAAVGIPFKILPVPWWMTTRKLAFNAKINAVREIYTAVNSIQAKIEEWKIDLVYTNSSVSPVGRMAARRAKVPHVWQIREYFDKYFGMQYIFPGWWCRHLVRSSQAIICHAKGVLTNYFPDEPENVYLIHNGVASSAEFNARLSKRQNIPSSKCFTFLMLSALTPKKGQEQAIRAISVLRDQGVDACLVLAGSGRQDYLAYLQGLVAELGLQDLVSFAGFVEDPFPLYYRSDSALVCSDYEALSRVALEAMSTALPVIGKNSGGTPEIIIDGQTGYLYDTPTELAARMSELAQNQPLCQQLGQAGWNRARELFSIEKCSASVYQVFQSVLNKT